MEIWVDILGFEGCYQVSNMGNVKSVSRLKVYADGRVFTIKERILKQRKTSSGYPYVNLYLNSNKGHSRDVHRMVAAAFVDNPFNKREVNHKNGIKADNRADNLEWVTSSENKRHGFDSGLYSREKLYQSSLKGAKVRKSLK